MHSFAHTVCSSSCRAFHGCAPQRAFFYRLKNNAVTLFVRECGSTFRWSSTRVVGSSQASQGNSNARKRRRLDGILIVVEGVNDMRAVKRAIDVDVRIGCVLEPCCNAACW